MKSLTKLLSHKYIQIRKVSDAIYKDKSNASYEKLRSRIKGRHRYTEGEYIKLTEYFEKVARKLRDINLEDYVDENNVFLYEKFLKDLPDCIEIKPVITDFNVNYYPVYDQLRGKNVLDKKYLKELQRRLRYFATYIENKLEQAQSEARRYEFSHGRGSSSHLT